MKKSLYNFFVWAAGSDREVLDRCGKSEHVKHAGYGGLVLVPAVLGLFSMIYAISTLTDKWYVYTAAGVVWAMIVFVFDRFIVSTFRKSESPKKDISSFLFLSRLFFSIGIGIVVSHPTVLLVFDDSLQQELLVMREEGAQAVFEEYDAKIQVIRTRDSLLNSEIQTREGERQCKEKLLLFEMSGKDTTLACGTTSGMLQYGPRSREIKEEITYLNKEIEALRERNYAKSEKNKAEIEKLQQERDTKQDQFQDRFSTNYLAREIALERLMEKEVGGSTVRWTMWFLIVFFVLIDILPVSFKAATKPGAYDVILEQERESVLQSTPGYEREQEDKVRKALVDQTAAYKIRQIEADIHTWKGPFPPLQKHLEDYVNVQVPYTFSKTENKRISDTPNDQEYEGGLGLWVRTLRFTFFSILQGWGLYLLTKDVVYLTWAIPVLLGLNFGIDRLVRAFLKS